MKVAVLYGGTSLERDGSLGTGAAAIEGLEALGHEVVKVDPLDRESLALLKDCDIAFNCLAGGEGENGCMQGYMNVMGIKYTGSGVQASAIGMNKVLFKEVLSQIGVPTSPFISEYKKGMSYEDIAEKLGPKFVIKAAAGGSSNGVYLVNGKEDFETLEVEEGYDLYYVEKFVKGREITVAALTDLDGNVFTLPLVEFFYDAEMYDLTAKRNKPLVQKKSPADLPEDLAEQIRSYTKKIYRHLDCGGIARIDYIIEDGVPYALELNTSPALRHTSGMIIAWESTMGNDYKDLINLILQDGLRRDR